jgi:hypothetical protein
MSISLPGVRLASFKTLILIMVFMQRAWAFDIETGNGPIEVVITTVAPIIFEDVSPSGGDATLVLRATTLITNAWFDAAAPYHDSAVGVYSRIDRRPSGESATNENINIAAIYASYQVLNVLLPNRVNDWRQMMVNAGLDPDDTSMDTTTAVGIGNVAGAAVAQGRLNDGMNQAGFIGQDVHAQPFADYTGYAPVNTAYELKRASRWQPDIQRKGVGIYKVQQFVTPQYSNVEPYSYQNPKQFSVPLPFNSYSFFKKRYKAQADEVLYASANLNDEQKLMAELFDDKIEALGFSAVFAAQSRGLDLLEFIELDFLTNMAAFDAGIFVWQEKMKYDAVRPFSAIRHIYGDDDVVAWGGPGQGAVTLPANQWRSYLEEADHPEYPSASTCFCAAHAQSARMYLGDDLLGYPVVREAGSSRVEPGIVPAADTVLVFPTWTEFVDDCGQSRVWAGVHFQAAVDESLAACDIFGEMAYGYLETLLNGTAPVRAPSSPLVDPASFDSKHHFF